MALIENHDRRVAPQTNRIRAKRRFLSCLFMDDFIQTNGFCLKALLCEQFDKASGVCRFFNHERAPFSRLPGEVVALNAPKSCKFGSKFERD